MTRPTLYWRLILATYILSCLCACGSTSGLINKVKRGDKVYENSCTSFLEDVNKLLVANQKSTILPLSEYENSAYDYFYLEPGQFEFKGDTLLFRLKEDLNYGAYIDANIAIHVKLAFKAPVALQGRMVPRERELGTIVVDRAYFLRNSRPFFLYKIPLKGMPVAGRQLMISFGIVELDKGEIKQYFCETDSKPIETAKPACCIAQVWEQTDLQVIADLPVLDIDADTFAYAGFRAKMDIRYKDGIYSPSASLPASVLQSLFSDLQTKDYRATRINIRAYPAILGDPAINLAESKQQAATVFSSIKSLNPTRTDLNVEHSTEEADWEMMGNMVQTVQSLSSAEKDQVLKIVRGSGSTSVKLAKLSLLNFYPRIKQDLLSQSRHIEAEVRFDYTGSLPTLGRYAEVLSLWDAKISDQVARRFTVHPYRAGDDIPAAVSRIDNILTKKADANLYAMRSTYMQTQKNYPAAIADLERAATLAPENKQYANAIQAYKILFADSYDLDARLRLLADYDKRIRDNPSRRDLFFSRAILMEKCGLTTLAINEYQKLFEGSQVSAIQLNNRGVALMKGFHLRDARIDFEQAISRDSRLAEPHFNLAVLFAYLGYERKCIAALEEAIGRDPRFKKMIFNNPAFSIMADVAGFQQFRE